MSEKNFNKGDLVVYPAHGVGTIINVETQKIADQNLEVFVIDFKKDRLLLRLPVAKVKSSGLRNLSSSQDMIEALNTLKTKGKVNRTMWARRAQEYESKINSGNPNSVAEVVRDLHRTSSQPEQSYSERQLYQLAIKRLASELAAVKKIEESQALGQLEDVLVLKVA